MNLASYVSRRKKGSPTTPDGLSREELVGHASDPAPSKPGLDGTPSGPTVSWAHRSTQPAHPAIDARAGPDQRRGPAQRVGRGPRGVVILRAPGGGERDGGHDEGHLDVHPLPELEELLGDAVRFFGARVHPMDEEKDLGIVARDLR